MRTILAASLLLVGCSVSPEQAHPEPPTTGQETAILPPCACDGHGVNTSGSRLRARYRAGSDGSREFLGWYDSQRDEYCFFDVYVGDSDESRRCRPYYLNSGPSQNVFIDAMCTTLTTARYFANEVYVRDSVDESLHPRAAQAPPLWVSSSGQCKVFSNKFHFELGPAIPDSAFVQSVEAIE